MFAFYATAAIVTVAVLLYVAIAVAIAEPRIAAGVTGILATIGVIFGIAYWVAGRE